jgi:hypothetical protein
MDTQKFRDIVEIAGQLTRTLGIMFPEVTQTLTVEGNKIMITMIVPNDTPSESFEKPKSDGIARLDDPGI